MGSNQKKQQTILAIIPHGNIIAEMEQYFQQIKANYHLAHNKNDNKNITKNENLSENLSENKNSNKSENENKFEQEIFSFTPLFQFLKLIKKNETTNYKKILNNAKNALKQKYSENLVLQYDKIVFTNYESKSLISISGHNASVECGSNLSTSTSFDDFLSDTASVDAPLWDSSLDSSALDSAKTLSLLGFPQIDYKTGIVLGFINKLEGSQFLNATTTLDNSTSLEATTTLDNSTENLVLIGSENLIDLDFQPKFCFKHFQLAIIEFITEKPNQFSFKIIDSLWY